MKRPDMTPGPWHSTPCDDEGHYDIYNHDGSTLICSGAGFYGENQPSEFNARAITALPEALKVLEDIVTHGDEPPPWPDIIDAARAVLIKAGYEF